MRSATAILALCLTATAASADPAADARKHSDAFARAVEARDVKAIVALYADDARLIWPGEGEEATGKAAIERLVTKALKDFPKGSKLVLRSQQAIPLGKGYITIVGKWDQSYTDENGKTKSVELRTTEIVKKQNGKTLYVVDHASVGLPPLPRTERKP